MKNIIIFSKWLKWPLWDRTESGSIFSKWLKWPLWDRTESGSIFSKWLKWPLWDRTESGSIFSKWLKWPLWDRTESKLTFIFFGQGIGHLPVLITVQDTVGNVEVVCCHLVDAMRNADDTVLWAACVRSHYIDRANRGRSYCSPVKAQAHMYRHPNTTYGSHRGCEKPNYD